MSINFKKKRHYYNLPYYMMTVKFVKKYLKNIIDILDVYSEDDDMTNIDNVSKEEILRCLDNCSDICRQSIEKSNTEDSDVFLCDVYDDEGVSVKVVDDVISVFTPLTFDRKKYEYVSLAKRVSIAFDRFENENPNIDLKSIYRRNGLTCNVFQVRMVHQFKSYLKDNNNENGAIVNEILGNRLLKSDNPQSMVTYTDICAEIDEDMPTGVLHLVIPSDKVCLYVDDIFIKTAFFKFM